MESLGALAGRVRTADIVDVMGRRHQHRCHLLDLVSPTPSRRLFGPAVTISYFPACRAALRPERYNFKRLFYDAIEGGAHGCVLVLASNGYADASLGGGTKLSRVQNHRLAGILADGRLRDFAELELYDLAIYCRGETTRWAATPSPLMRRTVRSWLPGWRSVPATMSSPTPPALRLYPPPKCALYHAPPTKPRRRTPSPSPPSNAKPLPHWEELRTDWPVLWAATA
jgi:hypothetical protein